MRRFGPTRQQMDDVTNWLGVNHFTIDETSLATRTIRFSATVTHQAERAFSAEIVSNSAAMRMSPTFRFPRDWPAR